MALDMHVAFNYGQATGSAQLLRFMTEHTEVGKFNHIESGSPNYLSDRTSPAIPRLELHHDHR